MNLSRDHYAAALRRAESSKDVRRRALEKLQAGNPLEVEPDRDRAIRRVMRRAHVDRATAEAIAGGADMATLPLSRQQKAIVTAIGGTVDFLPVSFLTDGRRAANAVGKLVTREENAVGTCFMISERLLITNHHVIGDPDFARDVQVEFEFEADESGTRFEFARFDLDATFFLFGDTPELDFTVVALGTHVPGTAAGTQRTFCRISGRDDKHSLGEFVNIIQHPDGGSKQVVLRENHLVDRPGEGFQPVLQYVADTLESSSGSPVFNDEWNVVALHHSSVKSGTITVGGHTRPDVVNEGTRASVIVEALRAMRDGLPTDENKALLDDALRE